MSSNEEKIMIELKYRVLSNHGGGGGGRAKIFIFHEILRLEGAFSAIS